MRTLHWSFLPLALLAVPALLSAQQVTGTTVWQIGVFDHSSAEFKGAAGDKPVAVDARAANAAVQWNAGQAGSRNGKAGAKPHPRLVHFRMSAPPSGMYALEFSVLAGCPRVPHLDLELNGKPGTAYLNRQLTYVAEGRVDSPINGEAHVVVPVPAALLRTGENELRITAVDDADDVTGDSSIEWDALRLAQVKAQTALSQTQARVEPTYFYVNEGGVLKEIVNVTAVLPAPVSAGSVALRANGTEFNAALAPGHFGEQRFEFAVPEFTAGAKAELTVTLDGKALNQPSTLTPKRKFTVMMVPHNHLDIGYTDYQPKIEELQNGNFDRLLAEMRKDPTMRYSVDGVWLAEQYLRTRTPEAQKEFLDQVRSGHIAIPAQSSNLMLGGADTETMVRSLYAGPAMNGAAGQSTVYANITDVPAVPWSYASALHAAGVKYFAQGANDDRGPAPLYGRWQTRSPFWWEGPDGSKVLMAYTRQYSQVWFVCGLPPQEAGCREGLPTLFQTFEAPGYVPSTLLMFGSQLENTDLIPGEGEFVQHWNGKYAWPHLELATFRDYFERIEREYGDKLETVRGDFGPYWEDGIGTDALAAATYRQTESRAAAVEALASFTTLLQPQFAPPMDRLHRLWNDLILYSEHTYTSWGGYSRPDSDESVRQLETKHFHVIDAREQAHWLANESMSRLLDRINVAPPAFVVFNSLGHERNSLVELDIENGLDVVEAASGKAMALETVHPGNGYQRVRFLAEHVPALGYQVYLLKPAVKPAAANPAAVAANTVENDYYRVTIDPKRAAVSSVFDKQLKRELVDPKSPYLLNQYLYVTGGADTRLIYMRDHLPLAKLTVNTAPGPAKTTLRKTPWGQILSVAYAGPHARLIVTEIRLFNHSKQIEFVNRVAKDPSNDKEAIYFAFPIQAPHPQFEYEGQTGTVNPARDSLPGANREWFTVGRWARVSGGGLSAAILPLDGPLASFGDIDRGRWPKTFEPASSTIFAYALNNYWHTNFQRVQSGDFTFRYVLTSGADLSPAALSRLGREALTPLETGQLISNDKVGQRGTLPVAATSFLGVEGDGVEVEALKPAEDGHGYVIRLLETSGKANTARLHSGLYEIERLALADAVETERSAISVANGSAEVALPAYGIVTLRAQLRLAAH